MIFVYNFLQVVLLLITFPFLLLIVLGKKKYRSRIGDRLGIGLKKKITALHPGKRKIIWIHSLSVGEVTSALPLVKVIRKEMEAAGYQFQDEHSFLPRQNFLVFAARSMESRPNDSDRPGSG